MKETDQMANQEADHNGTTQTSVRRMYSNFDRTGHFTATDLRRVLGDPCGGVEVPPSGSFLMASRIAK